MSTVFPKSLPQKPPVDTLRDKLALVHPYHGGIAPWRSLVDDDFTIWRSENGGSWVAVSLGDRSELIVELVYFSSFQASHSEYLYIPPSNTTYILNEYKAVQFIENWYTKALQNALNEGVIMTIEVVFRDNVNSSKPPAGFGTLLIPEGSKVENYIGHSLPFTATRQLADSFPQYPGKLGVISEIHQQKYFEFEIVETNREITPLYSGLLRILSQAEPKHES